LAQPCVRLDQFTGCTKADALALVPVYARQCFLFVAGKLTLLPTEPWATQARYTPGQVYCPANVDRNDVNPRPLSALVPSSGLCGAYSADRKQILAMAWEPYQEIFQGVVTCMHTDFRIGGLKPGETKTIRGKIYVVSANESNCSGASHGISPNRLRKKKQSGRRRRKSSAGVPPASIRAGEDACATPPPALYFSTCSQGAGFNPSELLLPMRRAT